MKRHNNTKVQRTEFIDFEDVGVGVEDPGIITREGVNVCPFGDGLVCEQPGCMACDGGARCCAPGDTCMLNGKENWCSAFRGTGEPIDFTGVEVGMTGRASNAPVFPQQPQSFWAMK
jgi:hypothetical protein